MYLQAAIGSYVSGYLAFVSVIFREIFSDQVQGIGVMRNIRVELVVLSFAF